MTNALIYIPPEVELDGAYAERAQNHVRQRGYNLVTVVRDWHQAVTLINRGIASVVVVAHADHLDPDREPRVEVATEFGCDIQASREGLQLQAVLEHLWMLGANRVVFPTREYQSRAGRSEACHLRKAIYETARLLPRGDDGGFAERFLARRAARDT